MIRLYSPHINKCLIVFLPWIIISELVRVNKLVGLAMDHLIKHPTYSFVVPIYNDGYLVESFCETINDEMKKSLDVSDISNDVEVIFVNDGSSDESQCQLEITATKYGFVKVVEFSRNFGQHVAVSCGYRLASGRFVGMMNVDMQDPPDQIHLLLKEIEFGNCDIVIGLRNKERINGRSE